MQALSSAIMLLIGQSAYAPFWRSNKVAQAPLSPLKGNLTRTTSYIGPKPALTLQAAPRGILKQSQSPMAKAKTTKNVRFADQVWNPAHPSNKGVMDLKGTNNALEFGPTSGYSFIAIDHTPAIKSPTKNILTNRPLQQQAIKNVNATQKQPSKASPKPIDAQFAWHIKDAKGAPTKYFYKSETKTILKKDNITGNYFDATKEFKKEHGPINFKAITNQNKFLQLKQ